MDRIRIFTDGSSHPARQRAGIGVVVKSGERRLYCLSRRIGYCSSLEAELRAIHMAIRIAQSCEFSIYEIASDCKYAIDQIRCNHAAENPRIDKLCGKIRRRLQRGAVALTWVTSEDVLEADHLAALAVAGYQLPPLELRNLGD